LISSHWNPSFVRSPGRVRSVVESSNRSFVGSLRGTDVLGPFPTCATFLLIFAVFSVNKKTIYNFSFPEWFCYRRKCFPPRLLFFLVSTFSTVGLLCFSTVFEWHARWPSFPFSGSPWMCFFFDLLHPPAHCFWFPSEGLRSGKLPSPFTLAL